MHAKIPCPNSNKINVISAERKKKVLLKGYKIGHNVWTAASLSLPPSLYVPLSNMPVGSAGLQSHACEQSGAKWRGGKRERMLSDALRVTVVEKNVCAL